MFPWRQLNAFERQEGTNRESRKKKQCTQATRISSFCHLSGYNINPAVKLILIKNKPKHGMQNISVHADSENP